MSATGLGLWDIGLGCMGVWTVIMVANNIIAAYQILSNAL